jgi:hypothetical protein
MNNTKDIINRYIGKECEECFINRLFSGVITKEKNSIIIFKLPETYRKKDTEWIIRFFEESWLKIYYSDNLMFRNKLLNADPEIFIIQENERLFCILNFND